MRCSLPFYISQKLLLISLLFSYPALASSDSILTLETHAGEEISLTLAQLKALPQTEFSTTTPWTKSRDHYQGPNLNQLIEQYMPKVQNFRIFAVNGYSYDFTKEELQNIPFILAYHQNGQVMSLRNKGPLWILIPFDQNPEMKLDDHIMNQCIWQANRIKAL